MKVIQDSLDRITEESLHELTELTGTPFLSIYLPTHRTSSETEQDRIRLKNLLSETEDSLLQSGVRRPDVVELLKPIQALLDDHDFWGYLNDGLAIFRTKNYMKLYRLPISFEPLTVVGERPYVKPLLPLVTTGGHFYLLALSQDSVRLFQGTRFLIGEVELEDTPTSLADAMKYDEYESQLQFQTGTSGPTGAERSATYHGHSDAGDEAVIKENVKRFLHRVDSGVREQVDDERTPLVLAGVEFMRGLYRESAHYQSIVDRGIDGNPDTLSGEELHARAWPLVEPIFAQVQREALERYLHLSGVRDSRASTALDDIVSAAYFQRVEVLFVRERMQQWGSFDPEENAVTLHDSRQSGDLELLDFAAAHTILNGGQVYVIPGDEQKDYPGEAVMAIYRYGDGTSAQ